MLFSQIIEFFVFCSHSHSLCLSRVLCVAFMFSIKPSSILYCYPAVAGCVYKLPYVTLSNYFIRSGQVMKYSKFSPTLGLRTIPSLPFIPYELVHNYYNLKVKRTPIHYTMWLVVVMLVKLTL